MLNPDDRCLLSEQVLPPNGYKFTDALICTYSLDLTALAGVPLALLQSDPLALVADEGAARLAALRAIRELSSRLTVFCQAGAIQVPAEWRDAFLWLESVVVQLRPAAARAVFHPKLWLLRYSSDADEVLYRLLVLSRNLTYDRSWDLIARLEGLVIDRRNAIRTNAPLVQFVEALGSEAVPATGELAPAHCERRDRFARELRTVRFEPQDDSVRDWAFWPMGIPGHQYPLAQLFDGRRSPFQAWADVASRSGRRLLVVSPFLSGGMLDTLASTDFPVSLVSRVEVLDEVADALPADWFPEDESRVFSFRQELSTEGAPLSGLHAKLWVADDGWQTHLWAGSANATEAAFTRNVEFLLQLSGSRSKMGIKALLSDNGLASLTTPYLPPREPIDEALQTLRRQQEQLDWLLNDLIVCERFRARITPASSAYWCLALEAPESGSLSLEGLPVQWQARPISVPWARAVPAVSGGPPCRCEDLAAHELTEFWTIALSVPGTELHSESTVRLQAEGDWPEFSERESAALSRHLRDADSLALYLEFMLAGDDDALRQRLRRHRQQGQSDGRRSAAPLRPLFETLLQALAERPEALSEVVDLVEASSESGLMQDAAFQRLWAALRDARKQLTGA